MCCSECIGPKNTECNINQCNKEETCYPLENTIPIPSTPTEIMSTTCLYMCEHSNDLYIDTTIPGQEICRACHSNCRNCYDNQSTTCFVCIPPKLLTNEKECIYENCISELNTFEAETKCEKCNINCKGCEYSPTYCLDCEAPTLFFSESHSCLSACPEQFYGNITMGITECQSTYIIYIYIYIYYSMPRPLPTL